MISREEAFHLILDAQFPTEEVLPEAELLPTQTIKPVVDYVGKTKKFSKKLKPNSKICHKPLLSPSPKKLKRVSVRADKEIQEELSEFFIHHTVQQAPILNISILQAPMVPLG